MKLTIALLMSLWSVQSHAIMVVPNPSSFTPEIAKGTIIGIGALVAVILFIMLFFTIIEKMFLTTPETTLDFSIQLEDYKDEDFKELDSKKLFTIYYENTAWDKEVPCMYEAYKLDIIKKELTNRGEKTPW